MEASNVFINIVETTLDSFDFAYCIIVNILTYIIIKTISEIRKREIKTWIKRVILLASILSTGVVYYISGQDIRLVVNSGILATVSWDIILKPICKKLRIDYKKVDNTITK